jgi:uncharacterized protein (TIGR02118 family)
MIQVSFLYPNTEGSSFDFEYYINKHCPLSEDRFGTALKQMTVVRGLGGIAPGSKPPFHAVGQLVFGSIDEFYGALMPHVEEFKADVSNYTDVEAVIQISEIVDR